MTTFGGGQLGGVEPSPKLHASEAEAFCPNLKLFPECQRREVDEAIRGGVKIEKNVLYGFTFHES